MEIVLYPNPLLRKKNAPIEQFDEELSRTARAMFELMYETQGVGLAAPQVGINRRLMVFNPEGGADKADSEIVMCNPRIVKRGRDREFGDEGCLSFPEIYAPVERVKFVQIEAQDLQGESFTVELKDWAARIFLHEFDHLDGILFIDRMTPSDKVRVKPKLEDLEQRYTARRAEA